MAGGSGSLAIGSLLALASVGWCGGGDPGSFNQGMGLEQGQVDPIGSEVPQYLCEAPKLLPHQEWGEEIFDVGANPEDPEVAPGGPGIALGDIDGDGWLDALFAVPVGPSVFFRNDGKGNLQIEEGFLVDGERPPSGNSVALADLDGDGDLDAFWGRGGFRADRILWNDGKGQFQSTFLENSEGETFTGSFADADGDGDLDLYVARLSRQAGYADFEDGTAVGDPNSLYINHNGQFIEENQRVPEETITYLSFQGAWNDYDGDGDLDIYLINDFGPWDYPNAMLRNDGTGQFEIDEQCSCRLAMGAMGAAIGDINGDRLSDIYITDVGSPNLLVNSSLNTFYDATLAYGADIAIEETQMASWGTTFVDIDHDGWQDLAMVFGSLVGVTQDHEAAWAESNYSIMIGEYLGEEAGELVDSPYQRDVLFWNDAGLYMENISQASGFNHEGIGRCLAVGDLDRDGRPDLVTGGAPFVRVWRNSGGCGPGITLRLQDGPKNRSGIGAYVDVQVGGFQYRRWILPSTTYSSSAPELYLGLRGAEKADAITVYWNDGSHSFFEDVPAGTQVDVLRDH